MNDKTRRTIQKRMSAAAYESMERRSLILEDALAELVTQRPDEARRRCQRIARDLTDRLGVPVTDEAVRAAARALVVHRGLPVVGRRRGGFELATDPEKRREAAAELRGRAAMISIRAAALEGITPRAFAEQLALELEGM